VGSERRRRKMIENLSVRVVAIPHGGLGTVFKMEEGRWIVTVSPSHTVGSERNSNVPD